MVGGAFCHDDAALAAASSWAWRRARKISPLSSDSPELFVDFYNGWSFDAQIDVVVSEELAAASRPMPVSQFPPNWLSR